MKKRTYPALNLRQIFACQAIIDSAAQASKGKSPGRHDVVVVDDLHEGLDGCTLLDGLGALILLHLEGVTVDAGNSTVAIGPCFVSGLVRVLEDHSLAPGVPALEDDHNLARLQAEIQTKSATHYCARQPTRVKTSGHSVPEEWRKRRNEHDKHTAWHGVRAC